MMIGKYEIGARIIALVIGGLALIAAIAFGVTQCDKRRNQAAQGRVDSAQSGAASNSAADAIGTVSKAGEREAGSEGLTRSNEREIRAADGADERVKAGVNVAGLQALCRRDAYRNAERCKIFRKDPVR